MIPLPQSKHEQSRECTGLPARLAFVALSSAQISDQHRQSGDGKDAALFQVLYRSGAVDRIALRDPQYLDDRIRKRRRNDIGRGL